MYLSPSTPTAAQPLPQINGEQSQAGPSRPQQQQQQGQWQPPSPYSPMMQPQQPGAYYPANGGPSGWAGGNRMPPRYHDYPVQQQQGMPQGYYPPATGYYPSYQQRPQHPQQSHPTPQSMGHLHYHPIQPQYPMPPAQPQPQPPPAPVAEPAPAPTPPPPTSSTPLNPAAQGFTFVPRSIPKPTPAPSADQGPVYASVAHPPYNPSPIPPHVAMMYPGYGMPMMMGMNPYQQMNPYQYPMPQHYQQPQQHQQPMLSPVTAQIPPPPEVVIPVSSGVRISTPPVDQETTTVTEDRTENEQAEQPSEEKREAEAEVTVEEKVDEPAVAPASTPEFKSENPSEEPEEVHQQSPIKPTTPQPAAAPYTYLSHPSPSSYAYLVSAQRPADPTSAPAMSFGTRTTMPKRVKEQATTWKGQIASNSSMPKRKPGVGMVFGIGIGKEDQRKVDLVFGSVSASEPEAPAEVEQDAQDEAKPQAEGPILNERLVAAESQAASDEAKAIPPTPSAVPPPAPAVEPVSLAPSGTTTPATGADDKPKPNGVEQPKPAPVKPSSWAALVRNKASGSVPSTPPAASKPASPGPEAATEPEAGPSKPNGAASTPTAGPAPATPRPVFNYAAAAASGSTTRTPAEEFARLLSEGIYPDQGGKGKGRERTVTVPRGLINMGNMCFANSILQVLVFCTPFAQLFEELGKRLKADLARRTPLVEAVIIFLREFTVSPSSAPNGGTAKPLSAQNMDAFLPSNVYDAMKLNKRFDSLRRGHQEDAEEFLGFFLNTLHEELLLLHARTSPASANGTKAALKPTENGEQEEREIERPVSPGADGGDGWLEVGKKQKTNVVRTTESRESAVSRIFGGKLRSVLHTPGQKDSVTLEPYQSLQLDVQHPNVWTVTDALRHMNEAEIVPDVWSASRNANVEATKQVFMETMPSCLILHVKRFGFEYKEQRAYKHSKPLGYGTELVIPPEIVSPGRRSTQPTKYKLFGIIYHHGPSMSGGHYTAAVARQDGSGWLHLDDESIEPIPVEQVVVSREAAMEGKAGEVGRAGREKCAYLAFYQRV